MEPDALFRLFSMTKPITCVALMMLYERGQFQLGDPVSKYIPAFGNLKVYVGKTKSGIERVDLEREATIRDLLTHTSGLTYHVLEDSRVEAIYREEKVCNEKPLAEFVSDLLDMPLAFQPGSEWRYSFAHDVTAYLIEVLSGQGLDSYLTENVFGPLGMADTGFIVPEEKLDRFAAQYGSGSIIEHDMTVSKWYGLAERGRVGRISGPRDSLESAPHTVFRGGHGLISTARDYLRFCQMLLNKGELDGKRLLGRKTVELMTANHLAPELMPYHIGGVPYAGYGYGLGLRVMMDVGQSGILGTEGEYGWGGAASTYFWIDPREAFIGIQMAQFQPSGFHPIGPDFRAAAYQAIVD